VRLELEPWILRIALIKIDGTEKRFDASFIPMWLVVIEYNQCVKFVFGFILKGRQRKEGSELEEWEIACSYDV
jgi:hypothetical protein